MDGHFRSADAVARAVEVLESRTLPAAGLASLVKDVNAITLPSNADYHVRLGDRLLFRADDGVHGNEWFVSDGTAAGTSLLMDINPGGASSRPPQREADAYLGRMAVVGDTLYFVADEGTSDGRAGIELWKTDGTPAGTIRVKDIYPGAQGSAPEYLTAVGDALYFRASEPDAGPELWTSDGTEEGTRRVADLVPGGGGASPVPLAGVGGRLVMAARGPGDGYELWSSDGTESGTALLKNINTAGASDPGLDPVFRPGGRAEAIVVGGEVYFAARDADHGRELWKTDGTTEGTVRVTDLTGTNTDPRHLVDVNGTVYFVDAPAAGQGSPKRVFRADPVQPGGAELVGLVDGGDVHEAHLGAAAGKLFLVGPLQGQGVGLFTHDPASPAGTQLGFVKSLPFLSQFTAAGMIADVGGVAYFKTTPNDLWRSDGTGEGTVRVREVRGPSGADDATASGRWSLVTGPGGALYFSADDGVTGTELYRTDGTTDGTVRVVDLNPFSSNGVTSAGAALPDGRLLFAGTDGVRGTELWVTDSTEPGTRLLKEIGAAEQSGVFPTRFGEGAESRLGVPMGTRVYFAGGSSEGRELWASDGTEGGTVRVRDIFPGPASANPEWLTVFNGRLYFAATGAGGRELWASDGTAAGTVRVKDVQPGDEHSDPTRLTVVGDTLYFTANHSHGSELWKTDGTGAGTVMVHDVDAASSSPIQWLTPWQGKLFFSADSPGTGRELWVADDAGAGMVRDLTSGAADADSSPSHLTPASGGLLFEAAATNARDVYVTDGSFQSTVRLRDRLGPAVQDGALWLLGEMGGWAYFFHVHPHMGGDVRRDLWRTDGGTSAELVATARVPTSPQFETGALGVADGFLYFRMPSHAGTELWRTDGTAAGTVMVQDVLPGIGSSTPANLAVGGGRVYFTANDGRHGSEMWSMPTRPVDRADAAVVYRGSVFGDRVAPDKTPLRPGALASAANVTGYHRGINEIVVELPGALPAGVTAGDFEFRIGTGGDPSTWAVATAPTSVELLGGETARYRIAWADGAIRNTWLRVTVKDSGRTGLAQADVFYFGNLVGETAAGRAGAHPAVGVADVAATRAATGRPAGIETAADHNRDGRVDAGDLLLVRQNHARSLTPIQAANPVAAAPRRLELRRAWEQVAAPPAQVP